MTDGVRSHLLRDLDLPLGDQRSRDRRPEQVLALVKRVRAEHREDEIANELLAQILDENVFGPHAEHLGLAPRRLDLLALAEIGGEGHYLRIIFRLQPFEDDRRVEAAGIGEHHLQLLLGHSRILVGASRPSSKASRPARYASGFPPGARRRTAARR